MQIEEDADREIEELKEKYEGKLNQEREIALRLKGDNTLMRKRQQSMQRDIDEHKDDIKTMYENEKELRKVIALNEKDIRGQRQEIKERDETIGDKEKRIFDLKRKNQELEKFKFVLDYKIKELKKQIEPKMEQIAAMKEQINKMDMELERYHKNNSNLELTISDLRLKLGGVQRELKSQRNRAKDAEAYISRFKTEVHDVVQFIQDPHKLKDGAKSLYHKYCQRGEGEDTVGSTEEDADVASEYARQRDYLEKSVNSLKRKLSKDTERHRVESMRIMQVTPHCHPACPAPWYTGRLPVRCRTGERRTDQGDQRAAARDEGHEGAGAGRAAGRSDERLRRHGRHGWARGAGG